MFENLFSLSNLAMVLQLACIFLGYPAQIRKIVSERSARSTSSMSYRLFFSAHIAWALHSYQSADWHMFIPQVPGAALTACVLCLCHKYNK